MKHLLRVFMLVLLAVCITGTVTVFAANARGNDPIADVMIGSSGINWMPKVSYGQLQVSLARPDGTVFQKTFPSSGTPYLDISSILGTSYSDGMYTYELRVIPVSVAKTRENVEKAGLLQNVEVQEALTQSGTFVIQGGVILSGASEEISRTMDVVHADDVIITGSQCIGYDCLTDGTESFGYDTLRLKENAMRIHFDDTSIAAGFPANDWRIVANDSASGGANYMAFEDSTGAKTPFKVTAGARNNALFVSSTSRVGFGTSVPSVNLHIVQGDTPSIRLDQDGSSGFAAQVWDLAGNETNFFVRDVTGGSKLPFRIQPGTPTNTLTMKSDGKVGIGTWSPEAQFEIETTGENAAVIFQRTDGATGKFTARPSEVYLGSSTDHNVRMVANNAVIMTIEPGGDVGIGNTNPTHLLDVGGSGAYCDGGTWIDGSSRSFKQNIKNISLEEARETLEGLNPVKYNYISDDSEEYLGFIAEDVPELVATKDRKGMSPMDVTAVLTKIVQEQQKFIQEQLKINAELKKRIEELENK